jgi:hypothetical protein
MPFKQTGPVFHSVLCFISIVMVFGYLITSQLQLTKEDLEWDDSYNDIKNKMS